MFGNPNKNIKVETVEEAMARGLEVKKCPAIPSKGQRETQKSYSKRVNAVKRIDVNHIPDDLKHIVAEITK